MKHKSTDYKLSAVKYYLDTKNTSLRKTCKIFRCSKYSLKRWLDRYDKEGSVENKHRSEGSYKVKDEHVKYIMSLIHKKPSITLLEILTDFHKKFTDITLSKTHLVHIIRFENLSYKKIQVKHKPITRFGKIINYNDQYKNFYSKIKKHNINDIIALDESSISVGLHMIRGRSEIGKRLSKTTTNNIVFVKYTLIMAISTSGVVDWTLYKTGGSDHARLIEFLDGILKNKTGKLILMDNASCHRNQLVKDFITKSKNDYVHILPYNHSQNPIEAYFNQLKHYIRKEEPMSYDDIKRVITKCIDLIDKKSYINYFNASLRKTKKKNDNKKSRFHRKSKIYKK